MSIQQRGRPRSYDRDKVVLAAARLFWANGYSGTSTRALTGACGLSSSSLYSAFGSKAGLFEVAVRTYSENYRKIYERAVDQDRINAVIEHLLVDSVHEFTQPSQTHPGCLVSSPAMSDTPDTLDIRRYMDELRHANEQLLLARIRRAKQDGELPQGTTPVALALLVQSFWHGLSVQATLGSTREELLDAVRLALRLVYRKTTP